MLEGLEGRMEVGEIDKSFDEFQGVNRSLKEVRGVEKRLEGLGCVGKC